jgi:hypothetical protein
MEPGRRDRYTVRLRKWVPAIVVLTILVALGLAAHMAAVRQYLLQYGRDYLRANLRVDVQAEDLDYNLFALSASLRGVSARSVAGDDLPPFLTAENVTLDLRLSDLLSGQFTVEHARFDQMTVRVVVDEAGNSNLPAAEAAPGPSTAPEPAAGALPLFIGDLQAGGPVIEIEDRQRQVRLRAPEWNLRVHGDRISGEQTFVLNTPFSSIRWIEEDRALGNMRLAPCLSTCALPILI